MAVDSSSPAQDGAFGGGETALKRELFSRRTQAIFYNYKPAPVQRMLDFDHLCRRESPSIAACVTPGAKAGGFVKAFFGSKEVAIPVYGSTADATRAHLNADVFINYASHRSAYESTSEALDERSIRTAVIIAEGIPERDTKRLIAKCERTNKWLIGPATVGGIQAGAFKIGDAAGTVENIVRCRLHRPGSVGFVSKSGGLSNEMYNVLSRTTNGVYEGIAVGGDAYPGSTLSDHVKRLAHSPRVRMIVLLGEVGGVDEYGVVEQLRAGGGNVGGRPVVAWVSGSCATFFGASEVQFGHAGARSGVERESAAAKLDALRACGAHCPDSFEQFESLIADVYGQCVRRGDIAPPAEEEPDAQPLPKDLSHALRSGQVRKPTNVVCTISDDRGGEPSYAGVPISEVIGRGLGVGEVISLLWFKRRLPAWATRFVELVLVAAADHGPCVSGAHNAIVAARAGKDVVSSLCSGLLTIGPRFGGAVDAAALNFRRACDGGVEPREFVEALKRRGQRVEGIGHRIKTAENRDRRVQLLSAYAREHFPATRYLEYAERVEQYTLQKSNNLVLNIDGCIGALFVDMLCGSGKFADEEVGEVLELGALNGIFVLSRSIGLIGHALDQRRMKQPLYRHPYDDVLYALPEQPPMLDDEDDGDGDGEAQRDSEDAQKLSGGAERPNGGASSGRLHRGDD